jgi:hypothetical protein
MSVTDYSSWKVDLDAKVYENTTQAITGANLNQILTDLGQSVLWGFADQNNGVAVTTSSLTIVFGTAMADTSYTIFTRGYDASDDPIDIKITNMTVNGFDVTGAVAGFVDWRAIR